METQLENGKEVEIDTKKYIYASYSQIEGSYYAHGNAHRAALADGWIAYTDSIGFTRYKKERINRRDD